MKYIIEVSQHSPKVLARQADGTYAPLGQVFSDLEAGKELVRLANAAAEQNL